ncbi:MAG: D-alanyl-D-alanine carboxypeptidase family protein [Chlamydiales bacterium]
MRYLIFFLIACNKLFSLDIKLNATSAILINANTGAILYEKNAYEKHFPASITKIATVLYVIEKSEGELDNLISIYPEWLISVPKSIKIAKKYSLPGYLLEPDGCHFFLKSGENISLRHLLYGSMLKSGNDAANALAFSTSGGIHDFIEKLNQYIHNLGCKSTNFVNPHGLHHPDHYTTAYDMALIAKKAINSPIFCEIANTVAFTRPQTNKQSEKEIITNNQLLRKDRKFYYDKAFGIKTGYTKDAGPTIVAAAKNNDRTVIAVLFGYINPLDRYRDAILLFDTIFNEEKVSRCLYRTVDTEFIKKISGANTSLKAGIHEDIYIDYYPSETPHLSSELLWEKISLPIFREQVVGKICLKDSINNWNQEIALYAVNSVHASYGLQVIQFIFYHWLTCGIIVGAISCICNSYVRKQFSKFYKLIQR